MTDINRYVKWVDRIGFVEDEDRIDQSLVVAWVYQPNDDPEPPHVWTTWFHSRAGSNLIGPYIDELEFLDENESAVKARVYDQIERYGGYMDHEWEHSNSVLAFEQDAWLEGAYEERYDV